MALFENDLSTPAGAFKEGQDTVRYSAGIVCAKMSASVSEIHDDPAVSIFLLELAKYVTDRSPLETFTLYTLEQAPPMIQDDPAELFRDGQGKMYRRVAGLLTDMAAVASGSGDSNGSIIFEEGAKTFLRQEIVDLAEYIELKKQANEEALRREADYATPGECTCQVCQSQK